MPQCGQVNCDHAGTPSGGTPSLVGLSSPYRISPHSPPHYSLQRLYRLTDARLMSGSLSVSDTSSPNASVRSSEALTPPDHVSGTTSPPEPEAITPLRASQSKNSIIHSQIGPESINPKTLFASAESCSNIHEDVGSDPNTPRLPPARNGYSDFANIPQEATVLLDLPDKHSSTLSSAVEATKHVYPLSPHHHNTFPSSISEPGSKSFNNHQNGVSANLPSPNSSIASWLETSASPKDLPFNKSATQLTNLPSITSRPRRMSEVWEQDGSSSSYAQLPGNSIKEKGFIEKRNRSSSRSSQKRVEKRIEATLADAEPSTHARSRKSSHTFGLFKETSTAQTNRKDQDRSRNTSDNAINTSKGPKQLAESNHDCQDNSHQSSFDTDKNLGVDGITAGLPSIYNEPGQYPDQANIKVKCLSVSSGTDMSCKHNDAKSDEENKKEVIQGHAEKMGAQKSGDVSRHRVPTKLLEEIRGFHNLAAPFHDKFRSTQSKPLEVSEVVPPKTPILTSKQGPSPSGLDARREGDEKKDVTEQENEEEEPEHISSALYYPHHAPSPDALEDVSIDDARKVKDANTEMATQLPEPALSPKEELERLEDVDIALQLHNKNRYLHGDLSKVQPSPVEYDKKAALDSGASSASESDYDSVDENERPPILEDAKTLDDGEATPRASPKTRKSYLASRSRKIHRGPAAPLGAVELKPFNHQVGGHTNLFRFSKRAVCKQLSNRENEFYEVVERLHPELLKFLPKYVLILITLWSSSQF